MTTTEFVIVLTTLPANPDQSIAFARSLVEERLAACVNVMSEMQSIYVWEGHVEDEPEQQILIKTTRDRLVALWERMRELHSYEVPEFLVVPIVDGSEAYLHWVKQWTTGGAEEPADDL